MLNRQNEALVMRIYQLPESFESNFPEIFEQILEKDSILENCKASPVTFVSSDMNHSLVPDSFFDNNEISSFYMKDQFDADQSKLMADHVDTINHYNVYNLPIRIWQTIKNCYPQLSFKCNSTVMLDQIITSAAKGSGKRQIMCNIGQKLMEISIIENNNLSFHNSFRFTTPEDCLYYLVNACTQHNLNYSKEEFVLTGNIYESGGLFQMLKIYLPNVVFGERSGKYNLDKILSNSPKHLHYDLVAI